jgi:hypothetical protein
MNEDEDSMNQRNLEIMNKINIEIKDGLKS